MVFLAVVAGLDVGDVGDDAELALVHHLLEEKGLLGRRPRVVRAVVICRVRFLMSILVAV